MISRGNKENIRKVTQNSEPLFAGTEVVTEIGLFPISNEAFYFSSTSKNVRRMLSQNPSNPKSLDVLKFVLDFALDIGGTAC